MNALPISPPPAVAKMPAMLEYAKPVALPAQRRGWDWPLLIFAIPALVAPFVDFVYSYSPLRVVLDSLRDWQGTGLLGVWSWPWLVLVATPFYLGIAFWACRLRILIRPGLSGFERRTLWILAAASTCATVGFIATAAVQDPLSPELLQCLVPMGLLVAGAIALRLLRRAIDPGHLACLAVSAAYVGGVSLPLVLLRDSTAPGWKCTLAAAIVMAIDFVLHMLRPHKAML